MKQIDNIPQGNPFKVPEGYFEGVNRKIISSTAGSDKKTTDRNLFLKLKPYLFAAASVAILIMVTYAGIKLFTQRSDSLSLKGFPVGEYSDLLLDEIDFSTLEEDAAKLGFPQPVTVIERGTIVEYLMLEEIDISEIQEKL